MPQQVRESTPHTQNELLNHKNIEQGSQIVADVSHKRNLLKSCYMVPLKCKLRVGQICIVTNTRITTLIKYSATVACWATWMVTDVERPEMQYNL